MKINLENNIRYGNCVVVNHATITIKVTVDVGPRIIYFGKNKNLLFEDDKTITKNVSSVSSKFSSAENWYIYGGHRLWKAPEDELTYYPDNNKVEYSIEENSITFTSQVEKTTNLQKKLKINLLPFEKIEVENIIINHDKKTQKIAAWGLTVFRPHGYVFIPYDNYNSGYLPNRNLVFWPYTKVQDNRLTIGDVGVLIKIDKKEVAQTEPFKIGTRIDSAKAFYFTDEILFSKEFSVEREDYCLDLNTNVQIYTTNKMVEIESLSSVRDLKNKESINHKEVWSLYDKDSKTYQEIKNIIQSVRQEV